MSKRSSFVVRLFVCVAALSCGLGRVSDAQTDPNPGSENKCDSNYDRTLDTWYQCDRGFDGVADTCWVCDLKGADGQLGQDGKLDTCAPCMNATLTGKICPPCKQNYNDAYPTLCYSTACGKNQYGYGTKCHIRGFTDYNDLKDNCPGSLQQKDGFTPTPNGCGPAGGGVIVPNDPCGLGTTSFLDACNAHDIGYGTCGADKMDVDNQFQSDMTQKCMSRGNPNCVLGATTVTLTVQGVSVTIVLNVTQTCELRSRLYADAVVIGGDGAFEGAQYEACVCCQ